MEDHPTKIRAKGESTKKFPGKPFVCQVAVRREGCRFIPCGGTVKAGAVVFI